MTTWKARRNVNVAQVDTAVWAAVRVEVALRGERFPKIVEDALLGIRSLSPVAMTALTETQIRQGGPQLANLNIVGIDSDVWIAVGVEASLREGGRYADVIQDALLGVRALGPIAMAAYREARTQHGESSGDADDDDERLLTAPAGA